MLSLLQLQHSTDSTWLDQQLKSKLLRPMVSRPVCLCVRLHLGATTRFYYCQRLAGLLTWGALSNERTGLSFTTVSGPPQRSDSRIRIPQDSWSYFTVSDSRPPNLEGQVPYLYPSRTGWPGNSFPFSSPPTTRRATVEVFESASLGVGRVRVSVTLRPAVYRQISSSWRQDPWDSRPGNIFLNWALAVIVPM
jgi:hypothetical protein